MTGIRDRIRALTRAGRVPVSVTATLAGTREVAPSYTRVRLVAPGLEAYRPTLPADGIKLEVPHGTGTSMRALSVAARPADDVVEVDILRHDGGVVGDWISSARVGDELRLHAVRREYAVGDGIETHLVIADASALPAAASIMRVIPDAHRVHAWVHAPAPGDIESLLPAHPGLDLHPHIGADWGEELLTELAPLLALGRTTRVQAWVAAEAATVAALRRALTGAGISRDDLFAAAYWKRGRDGADRDRRIMAAYLQAQGTDADLTDPSVRAELEESADGVR
jgi:NADPH-dependent ferric siderophore reductase